ncbi:MAG: hypothetical protein CVU55_10615 [Deltaproteobacteria bacterium HGW-Deltaproteobacteria-13]|jgi:hypothetical protein|nr:MAG: hypothetical protein CVU55_10615 [Deltaproteobacteria bacterium HGW-Deltaproteobacteria-13]
MKRFLDVILFPCLFFYLVIIPNVAISEVIDSIEIIEPRILNKYGNIVEEPQILFLTYCYDILNGEKNKCTTEITISEAFDETCTGAPDIRCGHNDAQHTPASRSAMLKNNYPDVTRIIGGLTNSWQTTMKTKLNPISLAGDYHYNYFPGEITGMVSIKQFTYGLPPGWVFLPPCESPYTCTYLTPVITEQLGYVELFAPNPPTEENLPYWWLWDGYVRCGKSSDCNVPDYYDPVNWLEYDNPYNWPAHPTTHWGQWQFLEELKMFAQRWYLAFGKPLVINDISLPYGGLLDCTTPKPDWKVPHSSHRKGIDADILSMSVPERIGRPSGAKDIKWVKLYKKYKLLKYLNLIYLTNPIDYNHMHYTKSINVNLP